MNNLNKYIGLSKSNNCSRQKKQLNFQFILLIFSGLFFGLFCNQNVYGQEVKKNRVRLSVYYTKVMNSDSYFDLKATARIDKKNTPVSDIELTIYNVLDNDQIKLATVKTDAQGSSKFILKNLSTIKIDSTNTYNLLISFKGDEAFIKTKKSIQFKDATINAEVITKDSINYISASLKETDTDSVLADQSLSVQVQRLFKPLRIGKEFNNTDENGTILVPIEEGIPGVDGNLTLEVVLNDSDEYGTVIAIVEAPIGVPIVDESTFDQRTMWGSRAKTPIFILIFTNLLIVGIWGIILYLIRNLFKIVKLKS